MAILSIPAAARRKLKFQSLDEVVADAERLVASPGVRTLGAWPLGRLFMHLGTSINYSIDGIDAVAPAPVRMLGPLVKRWILKRGMSPGFKLPKKIEADLFPPVESSREGFDKLREAVNRLQTERMTGRHPIFGQLTHEEWTQLHLRHAELHLSFALPE